MSIRYEVPKTLSATDMFMWWCKEKIRNKRYLKIKNATTHSKETILISRNGDELDWLREHVLVLAEQIEKLEIADKGKRMFNKRTETIYIKKREIFDATERIKHLEQVDRGTTHMLMSERMFRDILYQFNDKARELMVQDGAVVNMKQYLGYMYVQKIERSGGLNGTAKSANMPNWPESNKYKQELIDQGIQIKDKDHPNGKNWIVYFTDDYYLRYSWAKKRGACKVKNHSFYGFIPSTGAIGSKKLLTDANRKNPFLHMAYTDKRIFHTNPKTDKK